MKADFELDELANDRVSPLKLSYSCFRLALKLLDHFFKMGINSSDLLLNNVRTLL